MEEQLRQLSQTAHQLVRETTEDFRRIKEDVEVGLFKEYLESYLRRHLFD